MHILTMKTTANPGEYYHLHIATAHSVNPQSFWVNVPCTDESETVYPKQNNVSLGLIKFF